MQRYLIIIIGPTAIGKTALAIELAKRFSTEIISCDSRQFFKEMTIGTAVPSEEELAAAPHHFIQNKSIFSHYNVGEFMEEAHEKLKELFAKNPVQIMVGGSGLYVNAMLYGIDEFPEVSQEIKDKIERKYSEEGLVFLQRELQEKDPDYFEHLTKENPQTLQNPQRMQRFLAVCCAADAPYSSFLNRQKNELPYTPILVGLTADREKMYERINKRVDIMMQNGLLKEAEQLYPHRDLNALQTVGYRELFDYFDGKVSLDEAVENIKTNTRRFAKRQKTWFKRYENVLWFDYQMPVDEIFDEINNHIPTS